MSLFGADKKKILVVDDEKVLAEGIEARLTVEGYKIVVAYDGQEGVEKARSIKPDLIILDVTMPKINGIEACRILRREEKTKNIPIIILTALNTLGDSEKAFAAGANDFVQKPFDNSRLIEKIKKHLP
ncbi:MAG: response regulator [Elusimicrobia bacterium]|nr:response regulator [Candidatus Obscuribacterium magneticum]